MWTETYHRFENEAAFLGAYDAAGWARAPDGKASPPAGVLLDVVGPAVEPLVLTGTLITPGAVDWRWYVSASWFSSTAMPLGVAAAEVFQERPARMFAARDPRQSAAAVRLAFEARKLAKPADPRLIAASKHFIEQASSSLSTMPSRRTRRRCCPRRAGTPPRYRSYPLRSSAGGWHGGCRA